MNEQIVFPDEFWTLLDSAADGPLTEKQAEEFAALLESDLAMRKVFVDQIQLWTNVRLLIQAEEACETGLARVHATLSHPQATLSCPQISSDPSATVYGMGGYFSSGWPIAYLLAAVILCLGLVVGAVVHVSDPLQIVQQSASFSDSNPQSSIPSPSPKAPVVGRITGMVDCQWEKWSVVSGQCPGVENLKTENRELKTLIALGDKIALSSGLLEIIYDTGAKVILQGPVTYEVETPASGFLSIGKLTAKLEKKSETENQKSEIQNQKSFSVRTPTATVTDLGTEFGVEVDKQGSTTSHVFRGMVEVQPTADGGNTSGRPLRLTENESVQVQKSAGRACPTATRVIAAPSAFVRAEQFSAIADERRLKPFRRWEAYSQELRRDPSLLAYYDFQHTPGDPTVLRNVAANGDRSLDGVVENAAWVNGRMAGKHALRFSSDEDRVGINVPQQIQDLTLMAWASLESVSNGYSGLLMSDGWWNERSGQVHWHVHSDGRVEIGVSKDMDAHQSQPTFDKSRLSRWTHLAVTLDHSAMVVRFYVNGRMTDENAVRVNVPVSLGPANIGFWDGPQPRNLRGRIDELAVFSRPLRAEEIQRHFKAGTR